MKALNKQSSKVFLQLIEGLREPSNGKKVNNAEDIFYAGAYRLLLAERTRQALFPSSLLHPERRYDERPGNDLSGHR